MLWDVESSLQQNIDFHSRRNLVRRNSVPRPDLGRIPSHRLVAAGCGSNVGQVAECGGIVALVRDSVGSQFPGRRSMRGRDWAASLHSRIRAVFAQPPNSSPPRAGAPSPLFLIATASPKVGRFSGYELGIRVTESGRVRRPIPRFVENGKGSETTGISPTFSLESRLKLFFSSFFLLLASKKENENPRMLENSYHLWRPLPVMADIRKILKWT